MGLKALNKDRLYVVLHARGGKSKMPDGEDRYHWALLVGPKHEKSSSHGRRYHVKNDTAKGTQIWVFEGKDCQVHRPIYAQLVRMVVGKVAKPERLCQILENVAVVQDDPAWNCVAWVREALAALQADPKVMGTSDLDWDTIRDNILAYCRKKKAEGRFNGTGNFDIEVPATYDMLLKQETLP